MSEQADNTERRPAARTSRRNVLLGAGTVGAATALTACSAPTSGAPTAKSSPVGGTNLAKSADIPVGGGQIFASHQVVVTQPAAGQFKAFSALCTHMGCTVGSISDGIILCPCHGSEFSITDGSVKRGPAQSGLPGKKVSVANGDISVS